MNTADIEDSSVPPAKVGKSTASGSTLGASKKMPDFNDLLSGIMYRMRKVEYTPDHDKELPPMPVHVRSEPEATSPTETSFYYKESSLTTDSSEDQITSIGEVHKETVEVAIEKAGGGGSSSAGGSRRGRGRGGMTTQAPSEIDSSSSEGGGSGNSSSSEDQVSQAGSYVSKISQKVFVHQDPEMQKAIAAISLRPPAVPPKMSASSGTSSVAARGAAGGGGSGATGGTGGGSGGGAGGNAPPIVGLASTANFQGELKEKCMTFFSSVTRSKREMDL